jgi:hypothetical protein
MARPIVYVAGEPLPVNKPMLADERRKNIRIDIISCHPEVRAAGPRRGKSPVKGSEGSRCWRAKAGGFEMYFGDKE